MLSSVTSGTQRVNCFELILDYIILIKYFQLDEIIEAIIIFEFRCEF